jgi:Bacteriocin-protection, YdeI or OmpD-Associated/Domain of unknown function (DUF1905)
MAPWSKPQRFLATIYKIWRLRYVDVPEEVGQALRKEYARGGSEARKVKGERGKYIPVVAMVNGRSTRTTLVPGGAGHDRLPFNVTLRKAARADAGEVVGVALTLDRESRHLPVPLDPETALRRRRILEREFEGLPPGRRRPFLLYLSARKGSPTRRKRLARLVEILLERRLLGPSKHGKGRKTPA